MNAIRVYIATTQGPSEIQRIAIEDPEVRSVVCLNGTSEALPISAAYDAFVRKPTGVIEKRFGHSVFRSDVSERVSEGKSWHLGMFAAHALFAAGRLAEKQSGAGQAIWLSGEVDHHLNVLPVEHVTEKLLQSRRLFSDLKAAGIQITVVLPRANFAELDLQWLNKQGLCTEALVIVGVDTADEVCRHLGLTDPSLPPVLAKAASMISQASVPPKWLLVGVPLALGVVVLSLAAIWWSGFGDWAGMAEAGRYRQLAAALGEAESGECFTCAISERAFRLYADFLRPKDGDLDLKLIERHAPASKSCTLVGIGRVEAVAVEIEPPRSGLLRSRAATELCAVAYRLTNSSGAPVHIWLAAVPVGHVRLLSRNPNASARRMVPPGDAITVEIKLPQWLRPPLTNRVTAVIARRSSEDVTAWLSSAGRGNGADWPEVRRSLERAGLTVLSVVHEIIL